MNGRIFDIQHSSTVDGDGVRTAVFFKGCNLRCKWCHNPESQEYEIQMLKYAHKCTGCNKCLSVCQHRDECAMCGMCVILCPYDAKEICGKDISVDQVMNEILADRAFYEESNGGATFTGGECMLQIDFLAELLKRCKEEKIHTCVDTAGHVPFEFFSKIIPYTDTFLFDVKCISDELHIKGTSKSNKLILDNIRRLSDLGCEIIVRIPLIVGFNDDLEEIKKIKELLNTIKYKKVEILPYHNMGEHKYDATGLKYVPYQSPDKQTVEKIKEILTK